MNTTIIDFFIKLQAQLQILHWQTKSFARHKAYGDIYASVSGLADDFVEIYQGKYGRLQASNTIELINISDEKLNNFIDECISFLNSIEMLGLKEEDTDLLNIRDEVCGSLNKLKYLLTLD